MVLFAELSLRTVVEFYAGTAHFQEIIQSGVFVDIVKVLFFHFLHCSDIGASIFMGVKSEF